MNDTKKVGTIYGIKCTENDKVYVGATTVSAKGRWTKHKYYAKKGLNSCGGEFYSDIRKYGPDAFEVIILKENINSKEELVNHENFWITHYRFLHCVYNPYGSTTKGQRNCLGKTRSDETKTKISNSLKEYTFSEEHKRKISNSAKTRIRKPFSDEAKKRMSEAYWARKRLEKL